MNTSPILLSPHFTLQEAVFSEIAERHGINNSSPPQAVVDAARHTAERMEIVRTLLGAPIRISSWIRCPSLNAVLKSKPTSQHILGEAVDFTCDRFGTALEICTYLLGAQTRVRWHQLILEHTWVHISWKSDPNSKQAGQVLSLLADGGYATGLTDRRGIAYAAHNLSSQTSLI